jgi:hypothetical protein
VRVHFGRPHAISRARRPFEECEKCSGQESFRPITSIQKVAARDERRDPRLQNSEENESWNEAKRQSLGLEKAEVRSTTLPNLRGSLVLLRRLGNRPLALKGAPIPAFI